MDDRFLASESISNQAKYPELKNMFHYSWLNISETPRQVRRVSSVFQEWTCGAAVDGVESWLYFGNITFHFCKQKCNGTVPLITWVQKGIENRRLKKEKVSL